MAYDEKRSLDVLKAMFQRPELAAYLTPRAQQYREYQGAPGTLMDIIPKEKQGDQLEVDIASLLAKPEMLDLAQRRRRNWLADVLSLDPEQADRASVPFYGMGK